MKFILPLILLVTLSFFDCKAQEKAVVTFSGYIKNDSNQVIPFGSVWVKNRKTGTVANWDGFFALPCFVGDTVIFRAVGFKRTRCIIPETAAGDYAKDILLVTDTIMLKEAKAFAWKNLQHFKEAVRQLEIKDENKILAKQNFDLILAQIKDNHNDIIGGGYGNYRYQMQQMADKAYYGKNLNNQLLNPMAWAKFFQSLLNGDMNFKQ